MGYQFQQLSTPQEVREFSFFNSIHFLTRHKSNLIQFLMIKGRRVVGVIHFDLIDGCALSPWKASFGGFEFSKDLPASILRPFVTWVIGQVIKKNVAEIQITLPPDYACSYPHELLAEILEDCKFSICRETGQVLTCQSPFGELINRFEKGKLRRCLSDFFVARKGEGEFPQEAFDLVRMNRQRKNIPVKLEYAELEKNFMNFSHNFHWFGVWKELELVAASIGIRVREDTLYHFFPGHDNKYDYWSPMVLLLNEVYAYCIKERIKYLDLGLSSLNGEINPGLFQFKKNLGATSYRQLKLRWIRKQTSYPGSP